jgi:polyferredoxin
MLPRRVVQVVSAVAINPYFLYFSSRMTYQGGVKGVCIPGLNCYACPLTIFACPIGSLQHSFVLMSPKIKGSLSQALGALIYVLGSVGLVGAVLGKLPCGWICPFGFLQELLYKIPTPKLRLPRWMRWGKYGFLLVVVMAIPFITAVSWFSRLCPAGALEGGVFLKAVPPDAPLPPSGWFFWFKIAILAAFLLWFVFSKRPFCRAVCPLGAMFGICNRFSLYCMAIDDSRCNSCGACREVCPVDIDIRDDPNAAECIRCLQCKKACTRGAITSGFAVRREGLRLGKRPAGPREEESSCTI